MTKADIKEVLLYIAQNCTEDVNFGATKLNKLLFFTDYFYYRQTGNTLTGHTYTAKQFGPVPAGIEEIKKEMMKKGDLAEAVTVTEGGYAQRRIVALREPKVANIDPEKLAFLKMVIDSACKTGRSLSGSRMSEISHNTIAWLSTPQGKEINPVLYLFGTTKNQNKITEADKETGRELEDRYFPTAPVAA